MSTAIHEKAWRTGSSEPELETLGIAADCWVMPEPEDLNSATTTPDTNESTTRRSGATTDAIEEPNVLQPIRKDDLMIRSAEKRIRLLQQWECVVSRVTEDYVECEMHDLTNEQLPVEQADLYLDEFNHFDRALLQEGTVFYWSIGHETSSTGQVRRYSELRVRRMPKMSALRKRELFREAEYISEILNAK